MLVFLNGSELQHAFDVVKRLLKEIRHFDTKNTHHAGRVIVLIRILIRRWFLSKEIGLLNAIYFKSIVSRDDMKGIRQPLLAEDCFRLLLQDDTDIAKKLHSFVSLLRISLDVCPKSDTKSLLYVCIDHKFAAGACIIFDHLSLLVAKTEYLKAFLMQRHTHKEVLPGFSAEDISLLLLEGLKNPNFGDISS